MSMHSNSTASHAHPSFTDTRHNNKLSRRTSSVQAQTPTRVASEAEEQGGDDTDLDSDDGDCTPLRRENAFSSLQEFEAVLREREEGEREAVEQYESWIRSLLRARRKGNDRSMVKHVKDDRSMVKRGGDVARGGERAGWRR